MKKVALSLMAFALVGVGAFAQAAPAAPTVTIGDWGRQIFAIGNTASDAEGGNTIFNTVGTSWGGSPRITGLQITAHNDNAGFAISPSDDGGTFSLTDENKAWVSPLPGLTFETGINIETDTWRDTADYGTWDWVRLPGTHGDSFTFFRLGEGGGAYQSDVNYNKDGIGAWFLVDQSISSGSATPLKNTAGIGPRIQAGAAYTITGVGVIKAQVLGSQVTGANDFTNVSEVVDSSNTVANYANIQGAFDVTAVPNLVLTIGVQAPTNASAAGYTIQSKDYIQYTYDKIKVHARANFVNYNGDNYYVGYNLNPVSGAIPSYTALAKKAESGLGFEGGFGLDYDLGSSVTASGALDYINALQEKSVNGSGDNATTGVGVFLTKGFSNGDIGIGFQYSSTTFSGVGDPNKDNTTAHWVVPIRIQEWF